MRKSSRGNPYHDERGRFCSGDKANCKSQKTEEEYAERTKERFDEKEKDDEALKNAYITAQSTGDTDTYEEASDNYVDKYGYEEYQKANNAAVNAGIENKDIQRVSRKENEEAVRTENDEQYRAFYTGRDGRYYKEYSSKAEMESDRTEEERQGNRFLTAEKMEPAPNRQVAYVVNEDGTYGLTSSNEIQEGMIVEYAPEWCSPGEEKYIHVVKEMRLNPVTGEEGGRMLISTINSPLALGHTEEVDKEMIRPASKEKVDAISNGMEKKPMPWETDPRYKDNPNGKLMWLGAHPEHKYNDPGLLSSIKKIQDCSDTGVSKETRGKMFNSMLKRHSLTREEGIELLGGEEFLM